MTEEVIKVRKSQAAGAGKASAGKSDIEAQEPQKARRGRPVTGTAKSSTDRGKAADEALLQSGGLILNKVRLSPDAATALADLVNAAGAARGAQRSAIENALINTAASLPPPAKRKKTN